MRSLFGRLHRRFGRKIKGSDRQAMVGEKMIVQDDRMAAARAQDTVRSAAGARRPKVAIIGAGFGGLMTGFTIAPWCDVTIFEARDRVGGRVWSKTKSSGVVEAGGELIGYNHPLWLCLAREFALGISVNTSDENFDALHLEMPVDLGGERIRADKLEDLHDEMEIYLKMMVHDARYINPEKPWDPRHAHFDQMSVEKWISLLDPQPSDLAKLALVQQFSNDGGQSCDLQSYLANLCVIAGGRLPGEPGAFFTQSENLRCSSGNQALAECLAERIREQGGVIHQLAPVKSIEIEPGRVTVEADGRSPLVVDYVVLAIPPSLWPGKTFARLTIKPELPQDYYVSMGRAVKYLSPMKNRFWIRDLIAPTATSTEFGVTWEGTDNQIAAPGRDVELSLFAGASAADSALEKWRTGGSRAVNEFYAAKIGSIYPEYQEHLSQPPEFIAWPEDPWTGAGYSCLAPGEVCLAGPLLTTAFKERMFFAGEHTCFAYMGYMEGALQSGLRVADAIDAAARQAGL
jgi:monoamine oxidase